MLLTLNRFNNLIKTLHSLLIKFVWFVINFMDFHYVVLEQCGWVERMVDETIEWEKWMNLFHWE